MEITEDKIALIVGQVLSQIQSTMPIQTPAQSMAAKPKGELGVFTDIQEAIRAARDSQSHLAKLSLEQRARFIEAIREVAVSQAKAWARLAYEETGMGRVADKMAKNLNAAQLTPGIEDIKSLSASGDNGLVLVERAPYGLIASIEPATHPVACLINHAIAMIAGGNAVFFLPHPKGSKCAQTVVQTFNKAIIDLDGPASLMVVLDQVRLEDVGAVLKHPGIDLVVATGGPAVVEMSLTSGKKAIAAGPGNPPVVVDETADVAQAARSIVEGHSFDNNLLCIAEKEIIVVDCKADRLLVELEKQQAYRLSSRDVQRLTGLLIIEGHMNPKYIGQNASTILRDLGIEAGEQVRTIVMEVLADHPLVKIEQMMPVLPLVRVPNFEAALRLAVEVERGFGHTAMIHSKDTEHITKYARVMDTTIVVVNAPSGAGLAVEGEGVYSHTIASPTGEGVTTARTFTRERRLAIGRSLRIV
ncbi:MAG: aldehyde dehydrogenase family protein [Desulfitobacteriaceae bacterium]